MGSADFVKAGQMTSKFETLLKVDYALNTHEIEELFGFLLHQYTTEHEQNQVSAFSSEAKLTAEELEDLPRILELQGRIHQLENDKRVEKSLKLWSNMRLKIRDRKLKQREEDVLS